MRLLLFVALAACTGGGHQIAIGPPPPKMTSGALAGPACQNGHCTCRNEGAKDDAGVGVPGDGRKRFEIRLASAQDLWVTVRDTVLYKSPERAEECFYVDLPSGDQPIELRASNPNGVSAEMTIHELGTKTKSWYDTFKFSCGHPGVCSFNDLDAAKTELMNAPKKGVYDRCGSVKIKGVMWDHGKPPDGLHPTELVVRLTLGIYKYEPWQAHGDNCEKKGKPPGGSGEAPPPDDDMDK
jgi:hypothetical protein